MANGQQAPVYDAPIGQSPDPQTTPGGIGRAIQKRGLETAFAFFGSAAAEAVDDPSVAKPIQQLGTDIGMAMQDRWFQREWENFQAGPMQEFRQSGMDIYNKLQENFDNMNSGYYIDAHGNTIQIDPRSDESIAMRQRMLGQATKEWMQLNNKLFDSAMKYRTNPYVNNAIQNLITQQNQAIGEITGPSPAVAQEQALADLDLTKAQAQAARRPPASPTDRDKAPDFTELFSKQGPEKFMTTLTTKYREYLNPYINAATAELQSALLQSNPQYQANEAALQAAVDSQADKILAKAAGQFVRANMPWAEAGVKTLQQGNQYFPERQEIKTAPKYTGDLPKNKKDEIVKTVLRGKPATENQPGQPGILEAFNRIVSERKPDTYEEAVKMVEQEELIPYLDMMIADTKGGRSLYQYIYGKVMKELRNKKQMARMFEVVDKTYFNITGPENSPWRRPLLLGRTRERSLL